MADQTHLNILRQGPDSWNEWRDSDFYARPQLRDADLRDIDISGVDLSETDLSGANLSGKNLSGRELFDVNFTGANLQSA